MRFIYRIRKVQGGTMTKQTFTYLGGLRKAMSDLDNAIPDSAFDYDLEQPTVDAVWDEINKVEKDFDKLYEFVEKAITNLKNNWYEDELNNYAESFNVDNPESISLDNLQESNYKDLRNLISCQNKKV